MYVDGISEYIPKEKRRIGIVHHKEYLDDYNVSNTDITLNIDNLEGLCKDCHEKEHNTSPSIRKEYLFDEEGNLIKRAWQGGIGTYIAY